MRTLTAALVLALAVPSIALAAKPPSPGKSQDSNRKIPQVTYLLRGTLTAYTAANGTTDGSVSLTVKGANFHGVTLKGQTLTFALPSSAKVVLHKGAAVNPNVDKGVVRVRGPKSVTAPQTLATMLQALKASGVVDQGPAS
jgi:hypothetical protein